MVENLNNTSTKEENTSEVIVDYPYITSVKFDGIKKAYSFGLTQQLPIEAGDFVVVETARGLEIGTMITPIVKKENSETKLPLKPIIRKATLHDLSEKENNKKLAENAFKVCEGYIEQLKLDMHLIEAVYTLDRSKIVFIYVADERVDFRELLKELATALKCRIELRQIGPRDKAKMVGGIGTCGMETCCSRFLPDFDVVSINMAKNQLLALNIQKLSGQCGKLMCCLKYEDEAYKELKKGLPKLNSQIEYKGNTYRVTSMNVLTREAKLENRDDIQFLSFDEAFKDWKQ